MWNLVSVVWTPGGVLLCAAGVLAMLAWRRWGPLARFEKVSETLYRSAQPTRLGLLYARVRGIKTVINLRCTDSDREAARNTGLAYRHLPMDVLVPDRGQVVEFLRMVTRPDAGVTLVHCEKGLHRTGTMCAVYRVAVQDWSVERAIREMKRFDGFRDELNYLPRWLAGLDIQRLRDEAYPESSRPQAAPDRGARRGVFNLRSLRHYPSYVSATR